MFSEKHCHLLCFRHSRGVSVRHARGRSVRRSQVKIANILQYFQKRKPHQNLSSKLSVKDGQRHKISGHHFGLLLRVLLNLRPGQDVGPGGPNQGPDWTGSSSAWGRKWLPAEGQGYKEVVPAVRRDNWKPGRVTTSLFLFPKLQI